MPFSGGIPLNRSFSVLNRSEPVRGEVKTAKNHVRNHGRNQAKKTVLGRGWTGQVLSRAKPVATDHVRLAIAITRLTVTHIVGSLASKLPSTKIAQRPIIYMTSYVNSYVETTHLLRPPLGYVRNQPIKRLMAARIYIYIYDTYYVYIYIYVSYCIHYVIYM